MINKITIFDLSQAVSISYCENYKGYNAWITVIDEDDYVKVNKMRKNFSMKKDFKFFCQYFHDWSDEDTEVFIQKNIETYGPKKYQIQNIITFIKENLVETPVVHNLGVNCFAGVSRSTAIGIIAWVLQGKTPIEALNEILKIRPQAWPNFRILRFASEILQQDILTPVKEWKAKNSVRLYVD